MTIFELATILLLLVGVAGWLNVKTFHLPESTAMLIAGLAAAGVLLGLRSAFPQLEAASTLMGALTSVDFPETVLQYMLCFLLFAGAMQVDFSELRKRFLAIFTLATAGVMASTIIVALGVWATSNVLGLGISLPWAFVFGALISPTDPVAVLAAARHLKISKRIQAILQGEALFNDGVGIVIFYAALAIAAGGDDLHAFEAMGHVAVEALGGAAIGAVLGLIAIRLMKAIDEYAVEVALSLALATGAFVLSERLHVSAPIAVVVAGLLVGSRGIATAMSETTQRYLRGFWTLIDELLNALLFLLLGLELLIIPFEVRQLALWGAAIVLVVGARFLVVLPWGVRFQARENERGASLLLAWGGLHGALSLALALSLPPSPSRDMILSVTFAVVIFSVLVQGLTFGPVARRYEPAE